ncbi:hypothetical protein Tco_0052471 [Tanacetum coccineum]
MYRMHFCWNKSNVGMRQKDKDILEGLQTHANVKSLTIVNYSADCFPEWLPLLRIYVVEKAQTTWYENPGKMDSCSNELLNHDIAYAREVIHHTCLFSLPERLKADITIRVNQLVTILLIESLVHLLDKNRYPVIISLIHIESRKSPTAMLFDVDTGRISIVIVNTKEYHSDVMAKSQG